MIFILYIYIYIYLDWWLVEVDLIELGWSVKKILSRLSESAFEGKRVPRTEPQHGVTEWGEGHPQNPSTATATQEICRGGLPEEEPAGAWDPETRSTVWYGTGSWQYLLDLFCRVEFPARKIHGNKKISAWAQAYPPTTWLLCCSPS